MNVRAEHSVGHPSCYVASDYPLMQNLLRTLTESQVKTSQKHTDLKLLLSAVKETRVSGLLRDVAQYISLRGRNSLKMQRNSLMPSTTRSRVSCKTYER